jgi:osmotically-inducible protein OsmY
MMKTKYLHRRAAGALALLAAGAAMLPGCAPLMVGGMVGTAMVVTDRRTSGAQLEDQAIELKASNRVRELGTLGNVSATSHNRLVLLTGEVPDETERGRIEQTVKTIDNVRGVVNELAVAGNSSVTSRSNDSFLTTKVKATFVDAKDLQAHAVKVTTERATVYLMGIVTEREAARAAELARSVGGVVRVVRVFEIVSDEEVARLQTK